MFLTHLFLYSMLVSLKLFSSHPCTLPLYLPLSPYPKQTSVPALSLASSAILLFSHSLPPALPSLPPPSLHPLVFAHDLKSCSLFMGLLC